MRRQVIDLGQAEMQKNQLLMLWLRTPQVGLLRHRTSKSGNC